MLPIYFKLGYAKGRLISLIPLMAFTVPWFLIMALARDTEFAAGLTALVTPILQNAVLTGVLAALVVLLAVFVSYRLSQAFYQKREF
jgi:hypothetical protein